MNAEVHPVVKKKKIPHKNSAERQIKKIIIFGKIIDPTYRKEMM